MKKQIPSPSNMEARAAGHAPRIPATGALIASETNAQSLAVGAYFQNIGPSAQMDNGRANAPAAPKRSVQQLEGLIKQAGKEKDEKARKLARLEEEQNNQVARLRASIEKRVDMERDQYIALAGFYHSAGLHWNEELRFADLSKRTKKERKPLPGMREAFALTQTPILSQMPLEDAAGRPMSVDARTFLLEKLQIAFEQNERWPGQLRAYLTGPRTLTAIREQLEAKGPDDRGRYVDWLRVKDTGPGALMLEFATHPIHGGAGLRRQWVQWDMADHERLMSPRRLIEFAKMVDGPAVRDEFDKLNERNRQALGLLYAQSQLPFKTALDEINKIIKKLKGQRLELGIAASPAAAEKAERLEGALEEIMEVCERLGENNRERKKLVASIAAMDDLFQSGLFDIRLVAGPDKKMRIPSLTDFQAKLQEYQLQHGFKLHLNLIASDMTVDGTQPLPLQKMKSEMIFIDTKREGIGYVLRRADSQTLRFSRVDLRENKKETGKPLLGWMDLLEGELKQMEELRAAQPELERTRERLQQVRAQWEGLQKELEEAWAAKAAGRRK